jgi:two-component system, OmpR family, response regulator
LIVDDEINIQRGLFDFFTDETSFEVRVSSSGEQGIDILKTFSPTICIVDMRLPGMDGNDFIILAAQHVNNCLFIVHTGSMDYDLPEALIRIGIKKEQVLEKPVTDMTVFLDLIQNADNVKQEKL